MEEGSLSQDVEKPGSLKATGCLELRTGVEDDRHHLLSLEKERCFKHPDIDDCHLDLPQLDLDVLQEAVLAGDELHLQHNGQIPDTFLQVT